MMSGVPFVDLKTQYARLKPQIAEAIQEVLDDGHYIMGPAVTKLESELAEYCGARHAISCSSGTDAIIMPMIAYGVGPGDAVFVPSFTFTASAEAIILVGASPVFVDVEPISFNLDLSDLEAKIAATRAGGDLHPKAILAVDLFGLPAEWDELKALALMTEEERRNTIRRMAAMPGSNIDPGEVNAIIEAYNDIVGF